jgi:hypothetical protein
MEPEPGAHDRRDWLIFSLLALAGALLFQLGAPLRASFGARITGDEPFYLLTTESLRADGDLDLENQYARVSYAKFFDGSEPLWYQSAPGPNDAVLSPHNLGLSVLLLPSYAHGGLDGAKAFLGALGGIGVGLAYLLSRRATGPRAASAVAAALLGATAPWFVYSTQVYPEVPAALLVTFAMWILLGRDLGPRNGVALALTLAGLMWLGTKYAPVVGMLTGLSLLRLSAAGRVALGVLGLALGAHYFWFHLATYGGLTPYAVNLLYAGQDTVELVRLHWEFVDRLYRLLGLWVDREFGLVRWAPVLALALPGAWLLVRRRPAMAGPLLAVIAVQVLVATFLAITMRGWWFPGRMLIVVLPLLVPLLAAMLAWARPRWAIWTIAGLLSLATIDATVSMWRAVRTGAATLAVNPFAAEGVWLDATAAAFPLYTAYGWDTIALSVLWILVGAGLIAWAERSQRPQQEAAACLTGGGQREAPDEGAPADAPSAVKTGEGAPQRPPIVPSPITPRGEG